MGKIERLIASVMILLQKEVVSANEFATLFQVSKRTILRDMETLGLSNIPIYSIHGVNGGYGIMKEYKLDKRLLSHKDLENLLVALGGLGQIRVHREVEMTLRKIESMVNAASPKGFIQLSFYDWEGRSEIQLILDICQQAILQNRLVSFDYRDRNGLATKRTVEPYQLHFSETSWYLKGFCLERQAYRTFKLSRTDRLIAGKQAFAPRDDRDNPVAENGYQAQLVAVKARISPRIQDQLMERYGRKSIDASDPEQVVAAISVPQDEIGFQFLAGFGRNLKIIEPESYAADYRDFLAGIMEAYT
ncbi:MULTISPECIES: YafY family protein [unclassified Paenibacillus]|uniref:helix-turn-helix transcriptional regulator n=1 Tax=unclassified Paenibacillus TaxID=185978 RepID=UPI000954EAD1|nr:MULTISPECIES: YafY family protein [unclassified Paenibacillus]ASS66137.1 YafY family transcriptional regulator [Paenibacillus sp. RUD330]SIQ11483.1 Predicted DNA-binding transcriptional regulator YafY, contains an HTH and WYL domains [Paenibacillus sp. RU4X]SIQ32847.1 Predicted DNA-binding transcriptional regulator YafY, contains an HTH and WYL domains [Paenibacillus sp. RU4T]